MIFLTLPILNFLSQKIQGLILGLVGAIDVKGMDVTQSIQLRDCLTLAQKQAKNAVFLFR